MRLGTCPSLHGWEALGLEFQARSLTLCADLHPSQLPFLFFSLLACGLPGPSRILISGLQHIGWGALRASGPALEWSDGERMPTQCLAACSALKVSDRQNTQTQGLACVSAAHAIAVPLSPWLNPALLWKTETHG